MFVANYLKTGLAGIDFTDCSIEKYMFHIRKTNELWNRLSKDEKEFTNACIEDLKQHLEESVLSKLPENYQSVLKQSVTSGEDDMVRSYLRIRIQKIEKYMFHIRKTNELWNRLSKDEKEFTNACIEDLKQHLEESVLSKLPENYQSVLKQSVTSGEDDMVPEPQLDTFVLCRSKEYLTGIQLEDGPVDDRSKLFEMEPGVLHFICYKSIKALVESGKIDLL
ncbi:DNA replication complex GINS protein SLD5 [Cajanus cajan]|uniref:DNA replication complex GINS protein SLD5 n=1 Tax=Cajanus cajan TaxID=3821 RepID=UPI00098DB43E|nr:DNA replication complex GINS protein SLD5 [Cajanus cajan]